MSSSDCVFAHVKRRFALMGSNSISRFLLAAFAALSATHLMAGVIPPIGLPPGSPYQLIFVTADGIPGTSTTEVPYNTFVNSEAALSPTLPASSWHAMTSTADGTNANVNAPSGGFPVYNTVGQLVATAATGIYISDLGSEIAYDQFGNLAQNDPAPFAADGPIWTGSILPGLVAPGFPLGATQAEFGLDYSNADPLWFSAGSSDSAQSFQLYALSSTIISPIPEPATITLLGSALLLLGGIQLLWRRRRAAA
jgi:PEP-CTERM motif